MSNTSLVPIKYLTHLTLQPFDTSKNPIKLGSIKDKLHHTYQGPQYFEPSLLIKEGFKPLSETMTITECEKAVSNLILDQGLTFDELLNMLDDLDYQDFENIRYENNDSEFYEMFMQKQTQPFGENIVDILISINRGGNFNINDPYVLLQNDKELTSATAYMRECAIFSQESDILSAYINDRGYDDSYIMDIISFDNYSAYEAIIELFESDE